MASLPLPITPFQLLQASHQGHLLEKYIRLCCLLVWPPKTCCHTQNKTHILAAARRAPDQWFSIFAAHLSHSGVQEMAQRSTFLTPQAVPTCGQARAQESQMKRLPYAPPCSCSLYPKFCTIPHSPQHCPGSDHCTCLPSSPRCPRGWHPPRGLPDPHCEIAPRLCSSAP